MARYTAKALEPEVNRTRAIADEVGRPPSDLMLGTCGDANHSFGAHLPANELPANDYSVTGNVNQPVQDRNACCAIDIGMHWPASREWLAWLIKSIREDRIKGIFEVIGSFDGKNVRYWSVHNTPDWPQNGEKYHGQGHDHWTHVAIGRRDTSTDRGLLAGWTAKGYQGDDDMPRMVSVGSSKPVPLPDTDWRYLKFDREYADADDGHADDGWQPTFLRTHAYFSATVSATITNLPAGSIAFGRLVEVKDDDGSWKVTKSYAPVQVTGTGSANTYLQFTHVGSLDKKARMRAQVRIVTPAPDVTAADGRVKVLYHPR